MKKIALVAVAAARPLSVMGAVVGATAASAKGHAPNAGTITCGPTGNSAHLTVPFTPNGTLAKKAQTNINPETFSGCTAGAGVVATGGSSSPAKIKMSYSPAQVVNACSTFVSSPPGLGGFVVKVKWNDQTKSTINIAGGTSHTSPTIGFTLTGTAAAGGSFAGEAVTINADLNSATFAPGSPFGTDNMTTPGFGAFEIGAAATAGGCAAPTYASPGAFLGTDGGATTSSVNVTSLDVSAILGGEANNSTDTESVLTLGLGAYHGG